MFSRFKYSPQIGSLKMRGFLSTEYFLKWVFNTPGKFFPGAYQMPQKNKIWGFLNLPKGVLVTQFFLWPKKGAPINWLGFFKK